MRYNSLFCTLICFLNLSCRYLLSTFEVFISSNKRIFSVIILIILPCINLSYFVSCPILSPMLCLPVFCQTWRYIWYMKATGLAITTPFSPTLPTSVATQSYVKWTVTLVMIMTHGPISFENIRAKSKTSLVRTTTDRQSHSHGFLLWLLLLLWQHQDDSSHLQN